MWNNDSVTTDFKSIECLRHDGNSCFHINNIQTGILKLNCKANGDGRGKGYLTMAAPNTQAEQNASALQPETMIHFIIILTFAFFLMTY